MYFKFGKNHQEIFMYQYFKLMALIYTVYNILNTIQNFTTNYLFDVNYILNVQFF